MIIAGFPPPPNYDKMKSLHNIPPPPPGHQPHCGQSSGYPGAGGGYGSKSPSSSGRFGNNYEHQSRRKPVRDHQQQQLQMRDHSSMSSGGGGRMGGGYLREQVEVHIRPAADGSRGQRHVQPRSLSASRGSAGKNNQYHHAAAWVSVINTSYSVIYVNSSTYNFKSQNNI